LKLISCLSNDKFNTPVLLGLGELSSSDNAFTENMIW